MTDFYASSLATGTGTGTQASPWDLAQAVAYTYNANDRLGLIDDGTYTTAANITVLLNGNANVLWTGCTSVIGDSGIATIQALSGCTQILTTGHSGLDVAQLKLDANSFATGCISLPYGGNFVNGECLGFSGVAVGSSNGSSTTAWRVYCHSPNGTAATGLQSTSPSSECEFSGLGTGANIGYNNSFLPSRSIFINCGRGIYCAHAGMYSQSNTFYNCAIAIQESQGAMSDFFLHNNLIVGSTTGIQFSGANVVQVIEKYNAFFGNTSNLNYGTPDATDQILTAGPFVNPGGAVNKLSDAFVNFALNSTAGGGALCRGAGTPAYLDIGAVQSAPSGGSSGYPRIVVPRRRY